MTDERSRDPGVFTARAVLASPDRWYEGGGVVVSDGRIERVLTSRAEVRRYGVGLPLTDLGETVLTPGLVNAHAHLELGGLQGRVPRGASFPDWIRALLAERGSEAQEGLADAARSGASRCLATGTTAVGDIDSTGASERTLAHGPLRVRLYREALDGGDATRTATVARSLERPFPRSTTMFPGVSPHAPYTVGSGLWTALGRLVQGPWCVTMHWAETQAELDWLTEGIGPFGTLPLGTGATLARGDTGLEALGAAGLLGPRTSLVHANHASREELARVAAAGATVVHCPGTHAFFGRNPPPVRAWMDQGVRVALGTDSLASNTDLDLMRELALLRQSTPWLAPRDAWAMATVHGAHAIGLPGLVGELLPGSFADLCAFQAGGAESRAAVLEALTTGMGRVEAVFVEGRPALPTPG